MPTKVDGVTIRKFGTLNLSEKLELLLYSFKLHSRSTKNFFDEITENTCKTSILDKSPSIILFIVNHHNLVYKL